MKRVPLHLLRKSACLVLLLLAGCRTPDPNIGLRLAIEKDDADAVKVSISQGADKNSCANQGWSEPYQGLTPLGVALNGRAPQAALALINAGADVNKRDYRTAAPLGYAIDAGERSVITALIKAGADLNAPQDINTFLSSRLTPLMKATIRGQHHVVRDLLRAGAKPDVKEHFGRTAFFLAGGKLPASEAAELLPSKREVRRALLEAGANPDPRDYMGRTPMLVHKLELDYDDEENDDDEDFNSREREENLLKNPNLLRVRNAQTGLYRGIEASDLTAVKNSLLAGAPINEAFGKAALAKQYRLSTPLVFSIQLGKTEISRVLLFAGADPKVTGSNWSPLMYAARKANATMLKLLLDKGADPNYRTPTVGESALINAIDAGSLSCVKLLLDARANPSAKTKNGQLPDFFLNQNKEPILRLLKGAREAQKRLFEARFTEELSEEESPSPQSRAKERAAESMLKNAVTAPNSNKQALLLKAIMALDVDAVKSSLQAGAAVDGKFGAADPSGDFEHATPLVMAIELGHAEVATALLESGANPNVSGSNWSPLMSAASKGDARIVKALLDKGAHPNYSNLSVGETALMHAVIAGSVDCVQLLLQKGANPDAKTDSGKGVEDFGFQESGPIARLLKQAREKRKAKLKARLEKDGAHARTKP